MFFVCLFVDADAHAQNERFTRVTRFNWNVIRFIVNFTIAKKVIWFDKSMETYCLDSLLLGTNLWLYVFFVTRSHWCHKVRILLFLMYTFLQIFLCISKTKAKNLSNFQIRRSHRNTRLLFG